MQKLLERLREGNGKALKVLGEMEGCSWDVALCAQLLPRRLMVEAEGLAQTLVARGRDWSPLEKHLAGKAGSLPRREEGKNTLGNGTRMDMAGTGRCRVTDNMPVGVCLPSVSVWSSGRGSTVLAEGERQREESHQQGGSHKDRGWCPSKSHGTTKRLAMQRTKETLKGAHDIWGGTRE